MNRWALLRAVVYVALGSVLAALIGLPTVAGAALASPWALILGFPAALIPFQPAVTGLNRLAVPGLGPRRVSLRALVAGVPDVLAVAGLLLMVLALARPQITRKEEVVTSPGLDILLALDTSGSMRQDDMRTSRGFAARIDVAKGVGADFVEQRPNDRIGLVVFGEEAFTYIPLTLDHDTLRDTLATVEVGMAGSRGTAIGTAIAVAAKRMKVLEAPSRVVVLLTDGQSNAGRLSPIEAARAAAALDITVYTIGVGAVGGGFDEGVDAKALSEIADATGGRFFRATDASALQQVYQTISELEPSPAKVKQVVDRDERYRGALLPGVLLVLAATALRGTWLRRGP